MAGVDVKLINWEEGNYRYTAHSITQFTLRLTSFYYRSRGSQCCSAGSEFNVFKENVGSIANSLKKVFFI
jgi:hypothetical protein